MTAADRMTTEPADPGTGAQAERTALAWRRTALGVGTGALVAARLTVPAVGTVAYVLGSVGGLLAAGLFWVARQRYRAAVRALEGRPPAGGAAGPPIAVVAVLATVTGLLALLHVLTAA
jgi:putative membrane protein